MDSRLVDLELRYMELEKQVSDLSMVVYEQQKLIDLMHAELITLRGRIHAVEEPGTTPTANDPLEIEIPPHY